MRWSSHLYGTVAFFRTAAAALVGPAPAVTAAGATAAAAAAGGGGLGSGYRQVLNAAIATAAVPRLRWISVCHRTRADSGPKIMLPKIAPSRRPDCHSAAPPSTFSRCFNSDGERASSK